MKEKIGNLFRRLKFSWLLSLVIGLFAMVPLSVLMWLAVYGQQENTVSARMQELEQQRIQQQAQADKTSELCNMVTQVFLNTSSLTDHLAELKASRPLSTESLLGFYRSEIGGLEKVVVGNPYLYEVRVYSDIDDIYEMMPILYRHSRMTQLAWAGQNYGSGTWQLDFTDTQFSSQTAVPHIMSLVSDIEDGTAGHVGTLEVAVRMEDVFPTLFSPDADRQMYLLDRQGHLYGAAAESVSSDAIAALCQTDGIFDGVVRTRFAGENVLATVIDCSELGCTCILISSLTSLERSVQQAWLGLTVLILAIFVLVIMIASALVKHLLRGFYQVLDGVNAFSQGSLDARVQEDIGQDEVRHFAHGVNHMLDSICSLLQDNLERQKSAQTAQVRALQNQINAHFIYNVLEAIKMMAEIEEKYEISDAVTNLGKLLRYGMKWEDKNVTVAQEIEYIRNYIALMNLRFDYTVTLLLDVPEDMMEQQLPKMSLQPIVENAVVHGAAVLSQDTEILICASHDDAVSTIEIVDHGKGMTQAQMQQLKREIAGEVVVSGKSGNGIGLRNVQERLQMAFGADYGLGVDSEIAHFTRVMVTIPYRLKGDDPA